MKFRFVIYLSLAKITHQILAKIGERNLCVELLIKNLDKERANVVFFSVSHKNLYTLHPFTGDDAKPFVIDANVKV